MKLTVNYKSNQGAPQATTEIETPNECPVCKRLVLFRNSVQSFIRNKRELQVLCICPNPACMEMVVVYYNHIGDNKFTFRKTEPPDLSIDAFPEFINEISSTFLRVYAQAHEAKQRGLSDIAGPGYRKAVEFLLKDYAKSISKPADHERIEKLFVGDVVKEW